MQINIVTSSCITTVSWILGLLLKYWVSRAKVQFSPMSMEMQRRAQNNTNSLHDLPILITRSAFQFSQFVSEL